MADKTAEPMEAAEFVAQVNRILRLHAKGITGDGECATLIASFVLTQVALMEIGMCTLVAQQLEEVPNEIADPVSPTRH